MLSLLLPKNCFHCQKWGGWICNSCFDHLTWNHEYQEKKLVLHPSLCSSHSVFEYKDHVEELIALVKKSRFSSLTELWAHLTLLKYPKLLQAKYDILIPVPTTRIRRLERGFSPTELYARHLSRLTGVSFNTSTLVRNKEGKHQASQNRAQRLSAEHGFQLTRSPPNKNIWIIDDVMTTGATLDHCARLFGQQGKKVRALVLARTI